MKTGNMRKLKLSELIIVGLFLIGFGLALTQDVDKEAMPKTSIVETLTEHTDEIEPTS